MISFFANIFGYILNIIYELVKNYGVAIIILSILFKLLLLPLTIKQQKTLKKSQKIQVQLKEIQDKYKNNPEKLNQEMMDLYKRENMSPFSGCLSSIIQIVLLLAMFYLVRQPLTYMKKVNAEEIKNLLEIVSNDPMKMVVLLAAYYGLRRSEVLGLKWSAIDFTNKTISIRHKVIMNSNGIVGMDVMKTKSSYRTLPLIPFIEEELLHERSKQEEMKHILRRGYCQDFEEYICVDSTGKLFTPDYVSEHFKVILKNNGMRHIRFHDLRHSCASLLLSKGVPMKMIQDWLGHSDMGTTANIYSHIDIESKKASAQAIGDALRMKEQSN